MSNFKEELKKVNGFAFDVSSSPDLKYKKLLSLAEEEAVKEKRGLWSECDYDYDPYSNQIDIFPAS